jgi:uncharacterized protein (DUF302 family)
MNESTGVTNFVRSCMSTGRIAVAAILVLGVTGAGPGDMGPTSPQESFGVYANLVEGADGSVADVSAAVQNALLEDGFEVLADYPLEVDGDKCGFASTILVVNDPAYAEAVLGQGPWAAFALPLRISVFEDEAGVHVTMANPRSLNRTIASETEGAGIAADMVERIRGVIAGAGVGQADSGEFGQMRSRGLIGKTMGIMAGGPFDSKVEEIASADAEDVGGVEGMVELLGTALKPGGGEWKWGIRSMYGTVLVESELGLVGVTGDRMEIDALNIVGKGSDDSRSSMACPGINHSAAFPVELVVKLEGDEVKVYLIDEMFRMKMYFEDAGKMKFAMNMRMPGSIESEIRDKVDEVLY